MDWHDSLRYIGLFNDSFPPVLDGVTLTVCNYAGWLHTAGLHPCVVTPDSPVRQPTPYPVLRYFSLPIRSRHPYRYGYPRLDFTIRARLRHLPLRLVHSHSPFSAGRLALYAARRHDVPLIATFHSKYRSDLNHSLPPWMVKIIMRRLVNFFNSCTQVWVPQEGVEQTLAEYGCRLRPEVVPNGDDMTYIPSGELPAFKQAARRRLSLPADVPVLLFVGQQIREKGIFVIIDALRELREQGLPFSMHFIGTGYALDELRATVAALGLQDCVSVHGLLSDRLRLADFYAAADLFLFPSFYDNAPLVVREAAGMGTPALLPEGSTCARVVSDGHNGLLCPATAHDYASAIATATADRARLHRIGLQARASLTRSWEEVMQEVIARYTDILKTSR